MLSNVCRRQCASASLLLGGVLTETEPRCRGAAELRLCHLARLVSGQLAVSAELHAAPTSAAPVVDHVRLDAVGSDAESKARAGRVLVHREVAGARMGCRFNALLRELQLRHPIAPLPCRRRVAISARFVR